MRSTRHCCQILMKLEFSRQIFEKFWSIKFHENPSSGCRVVPLWKDRWTDGHDEANNQFSQFSVRAWKWLGKKTCATQTHTRSRTHAKSKFQTASINKRYIPHKYMSLIRHSNPCITTKPCSTTVRTDCAECTCTPPHDSKKRWYFCVPFVFSTLRQPTIRFLIFFFRITRCVSALKDNNKFN